MQAVVTAPRAAQTHNLHRAGGRFGVAFVLARLRALDTAGVLGRTSSLFRAALVAMSLQELAHQLLAPPVQFPFEFALAHLPGFAGREEGFGIREDSIGRCEPNENAPGLASGDGARLGGSMQGTQVAHSGETDHPFRWQTDHPFRRKPITCRSEATRDEIMSPGSPFGSTVGFVSASSLLSGRACTHCARDGRESRWPASGRR